MFNELIKDPIFIQIIGFVALIFSLLVFQVNKRRSMLNLHICASLFYSIHFFLLGAFTGSIVYLINMVRNYLFYAIDEKRRTWLIPCVFIICFTVASILTWKDWTSILPIISAISGTLAFWQRSPKLIRLFSLMVSPPWFIYGALSGSYPVMIAEFIMFSSDLIGIYRFNVCKIHHNNVEVRKRRKLHP